MTELIIGWTIVNVIVGLWFVFYTRARIKATRANTTKVCPRCGDTQMIRFTSLNLKYCSGCRTWLTWNLEPGQKPLF